MGILIKDIKRPENCIDCICCSFDDNGYMCKAIKSHPAVPSGGILADCPIKEIGECKKCRHFRRSDYEEFDYCKMRYGLKGYIRDRFCDMWEAKKK